MAGGEPCGHSSPQALVGDAVPGKLPVTNTFDVDRLAQIVRDASRVVLTTHIRPDCDALGSQLAMSRLLRFLGKEALAVNAFDIPRHLRFVDRRGELRRLEEADCQQFIPKADLVIILDTSAWAQLGEMAEVVRRSTVRKVVVDHHVTADDMGAERFCDPGAEATGRLVYALAKHVGMPVDAEFAWYIFLALATDTGWFRFASVSAATYQLAAELVTYGVSAAEVYRQLYETETLGRIRLIGQALGRAQVDGNGRLIYSWLDREDFEHTGALPSDSEDIINLMLAVEGVEVAVLFIEQPTRAMKISLRSRNNLNCAAIASAFGGGGHRNAAGIFFTHPWPISVPPEEEPRRWLRGVILDAIRRAMA
ncbi:MAG: bifunctional oligoribonuclease/PAP phosphatase NrnA [Thermoguttaceae bacterium]|nr:bifunctional oligoribonuclease/PAP phosphatase NrnA [Thermoguttaceae bacterium]MDW8078988.1 bifunctional oligoribonuclease/PAP phosphatase NrnA [Thermoguttaceae bacterium]